jgi:hypothetical protein
MNRRTWLHLSGAGLAALIGERSLKAVSAMPADLRDRPVVLPHPQSISYGTQRINLTDRDRLAVSLEPDPEAGPEAAEAAQMIAAELARRTGRAPSLASKSASGEFPIQFRGFKDSQTGKETEVEGGYRLSVARQGVEIASRGVGFQYAAATFTQLLEQDNAPRLREVEIRDWPTFPWRGIYVEVTSGACMTLADWKDLVDWASSLKLNLISVGLYNCWERPTTVLDAEYFLFPSRRYPQFNTPVRCYTQQQGHWEQQTALPAMYSQNFLGEIVAYGKARGISVTPYFSSLGHNTVIPRLMPEVSMKDEQCRAIGYGFCTTCPQTYEVLFNLYDEIIERHARPYGISVFNVAMDEVQHSCQCPTCRVTWKGEDNFYVDHLIKISRHLKDQGMTRVLVWNDMLHRSGLINKELESRLAAAGLGGLITIGWWNYNSVRDAYFPPDDSFGRAFFRPNIGINAWAVPSNGWDTTALLGATQSTANNALFRLVRQGKERGADGVISYSNHDPIFQHGYVNASQYAWNPTPNLADTQERYARWLFGADHESGSHALKAYHDVYGTYAELAEAFYRRPVPPSLGGAIDSVRGPGLKKIRLRDSVASMDSAARTLKAIQTRIKDPGKAKSVGMYYVEVRRLGAFLRLTLAILNCTSAYDHFRSERDPAALGLFTQSLQALRQSGEEHGTVVRELSDLRYTPSLPRILPYEQKAQDDTKQFIAIFSEMERRGRAGQTNFLPEIVIKNQDFFASSIGMVLP